MRPDAVTWGPKEFILGHLGLTLFTQKSYVVACRPNAVTWEPNAITREPNAVPWRSNFITRGFTELAFASYAKQRGVIRGAKRFFQILKEFVSFNCDSSAVFDSILTSKMCIGQFLAALVFTKLLNFDEFWLSPAPTFLGINLKIGFLKNGFADFFPVFCIVSQISSSFWIKNKK